MSGYLRFPDGSAAGGAEVAVEYLRADSAAAQAWATLASAVAAADGTWRSTVELPATGQLRAVFAGDATRARLESAPRDVTVLARLNLALDRNRIRLGQRVNLSGTADPATHVRLTLQRPEPSPLADRPPPADPRARGHLPGVVRPRGRGKYRITAQVGRIVRRRTIKVL